MKAPLPWCSRLAAVSDDTLGAALRDLAATRSERGLVEILHARVSEPGDSGLIWWLHLALVFEQPPAEAPEDTALGRAVQLLVERHAHVWGMLHYYRPGAPALARYHRAPEGHPVPALPPLPTYPWLASREKAAEEPKPARSAPKPPKPTAPVPPPAAPTSTQGSLFG